MAGRTILSGSSHNTVKKQNSTNELPNMSLDSKVIETEAPKNDMITVDSRYTTKSKTEFNA